MPPVSFQFVQIIIIQVWPYLMFPANLVSFRIGLHLAPEEHVLTLLDVVPVQIDSEVELYARRV